MTAATTSAYLVIIAYPSNVSFLLSFFFFIDPAPTEFYTLPLHDALPICPARHAGAQAELGARLLRAPRAARFASRQSGAAIGHAQAPPQPAQRGHGGRRLRHRRRAKHEIGRAHV